MKIHSFFKKLYLLLTLAIVPLNADADTVKLDDFQMVNVESVEALPDLETRSLKLKIKVLFWQVFQYQTFEMNMDWNSIDILNIKAGDQIGWRSQNQLDFSSFGFSYYDIYFPNSNVILTARGKANIPLHILKNKDSLRHVFELKDNENGYFSFLSEGNTKWYIDQDYFVELKNGDGFYIDHNSEQPAWKVIGGSSFKILSSSGKEIGEIIGKSTKQHWEPSPEHDRVFTVVKVARELNPYKKLEDQFHVLLRHDQTGKEFFLPGYFLGEEGERIMIIDLSSGPCYSLIYYIIDRKIWVGNKEDCSYVHLDVDGNIRVNYVAWLDDFVEVPMYPDNSYLYFTDPPMYRNGEDGAAWFIKDFCPRKNGGKLISRSDFFAMVDNYCRENLMNVPDRYGSKTLKEFLSPLQGYYNFGFGCK